MRFLLSILSLVFMTTICVADGESWVEPDQRFVLSARPTNSAALQRLEQLYNWGRQTGHWASWEECGFGSFRLKKNADEQYLGALPYIVDIVLNGYNTGNERAGLRDAQPGEEAWTIELLIKAFASAKQTEMNVNALFFYLDGEKVMDSEDDDDEVDAFDLLQAAPPTPDKKHRYLAESIAAIVSTDWRRDWEVYQGNREAMFEGTCQDKLLELLPRETFGDMKAADLRQGPLGYYMDLYLPFNKPSIPGFVAADDGMLTTFAPCVGDFDGVWTMYGSFMEHHYDETGPDVKVIDLSKSGVCNIDEFTTVLLEMLQLGAVRGSLEVLKLTGFPWDLSTQGGGALDGLSWTLPHFTKLKELHIGPAEADEPTKFPYWFADDLAEIMRANPELQVYGFSLDLFDRGYYHELPQDDDLRDDDQGAFGDARRGGRRLVVPGFSDDSDDEDFSDDEPAGEYQAGGIRSVPALDDSDDEDFSDDGDVSSGTWSSGEEEEEYDGDQQFLDEAAEIDG